MDSSNTKRSDTSSARSPDPTDPQLSQCIWLKVGHTYERRYWKSGRAVPEDWRVWVRGVAGADISALVNKVVFELCPDTQFPFPKRICLEAPYELEESGSAPTEVLITVHLKCGAKPEKIQLNYGSLFHKADESSADSRCIFYNIEIPSQQPRLRSLPETSVIAPVSATARPRPHTQQAAIPNDDVDNKKYEELIDPWLSHEQALLFESCALCDSAKEGSSVCPLLMASSSKKSSSYKKKMPKMHSARRHCHRCLIRVTPCPSCQPRRIPKLPLMSKLATR